MIVVRAITAIAFAVASQAALADANSCITLMEDGLYGGFKNACDQKINLSYCAYKPKPGSSLAISYDCERQQFGLITASPRSPSTAHTKAAESIHWYACAAPQTPVAQFSNGRVQGRCR